MGTPSIPNYFGTGELSAKSVEIRWRAQRTSSVETLVPVEGTILYVGGHGTQSVTLPVPLHTSRLLGPKMTKELSGEKKSRKTDFLELEMAICYLFHSSVIIVGLST